MSTAFGKESGRGGVLEHGKRTFARGEMVVIMYNFDVYKYKPG